MTPLILAPHEQDASLLLRVMDKQPRDDRLIFDRYEVRQDPVYGKWVVGPAGVPLVQFMQVAYGYAAFPEPPWKPGDVVPCLEAWGIGDWNDTHFQVVYGVEERQEARWFPRRDEQGARLMPHLTNADTFDGDIAGVNRPAESMPLWAVRHWRRVLEVEPRRVCDLSEGDARQCGFNPVMHDTGGVEPWGASCPDVPCWTEAAADWWRETHPRFPWETSWVWACRVEPTERTER